MNEFIPLYCIGFALSVSMMVVTLYSVLSKHVTGAILAQRTYYCKPERLLPVSCLRMFGIKENCHIAPGC